jgi:protein-S-isoprenylcysteine O-methyltransferase Ste14
MEKSKPKLNKHGLRMVIREYISRFFFLTILLLAAGDTDWPRAWAFFILVLLTTILFHLLVVGPEPDLYNERGQIKGKVAAWDKRWLIGYAFLSYILLLVIGLDKRFGWSYSGDSWMIPGALLVIASNLMAAWSMRVNRFFSSVVRIQADRGHKVCSEGPYSVIRHPGYAAVSLYFLGVPLFLGSWIGFIPASVCILWYAVRILYEENVLVEGLDGYKEYTQKVKYRLIPGVW